MSFEDLKYPRNIRKLENLTNKINFGDKARDSILENHMPSRKRLETLEQLTEKLSSIDQEMIIRQYRFQTFFRKSGLGIALVAVDGKWIDLNDALCKIIGGEDCRQMVGTCCADYTHPEDVDMENKCVERMLDGEISHYQVEKRFISRKDGSIIWVLRDVILVRDDDETPLYFIVQIVDITDMQNERQPRITKAN